MQLITTDQSVAGRGVFCLEDLEDGEVVAAIPNKCIFYPENASKCFPNAAHKLEQAVSSCNTHTRDTSDHGWIRVLWRRLLGRNSAPKDKKDELDSQWLPELTQYALTACAEGHPWSEWIQQWQRDDPTHRLYLSGARHDDEKALVKAAEEYTEIMPELPNTYLQAALSIRLQRLERDKAVFLGINDEDETAFSRMYSLVSSRVVELDDDVSGVIPFYDMINHSLEPNLSLSYHGDHVELFTTRPVEAGEELFLQYTKRGREMDESNALWTLVQWGIPTDWSQVSKRELI